MNDRNILHLAPVIRSIYLQKWLPACIKEGINAHAIVTWRSAADQNKAKASGLSNAYAGESPHNCLDQDGEPCSLAFDFGIFEDDGSYVQDGHDPRYKQAGEIGKACGLIWGGDWHHPDYDHLEMPNWKTINT